jgi:hypothetical protein
MGELACDVDIYDIEIYLINVSNDEIVCQANESIPITGYPDLKTGPDPGWNPSESLILLDNLILVNKEQEGVNEGWKDQQRSMNQSWW